MSDPALAPSWDRLARSLDRFAEAHGGPAPFWLRDDDAVAPGSALRRLFDIADESGVPVSLAVIPALAEPSLIAALDERRDVAVLQHGYAHVDHAPTGEKSREFGPDRETDAMAAEILDGRRRLEGFAGFVPIFVPPWNRIAPALASRLPGLGFPVLSGYTNRREPEPVEGLVTLNTRIDPVDWHAGRGLLAPAQVLGRLAERLEGLAGEPDGAGRPIGLLTHHLVHDEETFAFVGQLLQFLARGGLTHWLSGAMLLKEFGPGEPMVAK